MKLYRVKIPAIAHEVVETLCNESLIEVAPENRQEAEADLVAIMDEYVRRDNDLRDAVKEHMSNNAVPYEKYGKIRSQIAEEWGHPTRDDIERYLARQFAENFMISQFVEEVFADDKELYKRLVQLVQKHDVDEQALRAEAQEKILNVAEGTVEYEIAFNNALREVKKRHGLIEGKHK